MHVMSVVGARPNFMKIAPLCRALATHADRFTHTLVHTGQHYDAAMSAAFFEQLDIPAPDINLGVGSGTHAQQVGNTMIAFERVLAQHRPDLVIVVGDVNATLACSVTAKKAGIPVAHIEAGIRSFDLSMPEEINRMVTDRVSDILYAPDAFAVANLLAEGAAEHAVQMVGNIMIDTLDHSRAAAEQLTLEQATGGASIVDGDYAVVTLHRPSNVDDPAVLAGLVGLIADQVAADMPVVWPLHPRTAARLADSGLRAVLEESGGVFLAEPLGYLELLRLNMGARVMLTDSGGLQEECCVLGTPCVTLRTSTERPVTLREHGGTCWLAGSHPAAAQAAYREAVQTPRLAHRPLLWDGKTAERIAAHLAGTA